jgi:outer membrane protein assembly factor BamB
MWDTVVSFAVDEMTSTINWTSHLGYGFDISPVPPVEKDGTVFVSTQRGYIYALDAATGTMEWELRVSESMVSGILPLSSDEVLVTSVDGSVSYVAPEQP